MANLVKYSLSHYLFNRFYDYSPHPGRRRCKAFFLPRHKHKWTQSPHNFYNTFWSIFNYESREKADKNKRAALGMMLLLLVDNRERGLYTAKMSLLVAKKSLELPCHNKPKTCDFFPPFRSLCVYVRTFRGKTFLHQPTHMSLSAFWYVFLLSHY